jgi:uncharacterized protein
MTGPNIATQGFFSLGPTADLLTGRTTGYHMGVHNFTRLYTVNGFRPAQLTGELQGTLLKPQFRNGLGVVVLAGSSGRVDVARANLFAMRGAVALAMRWFGGEGQVPGICEIPLEGFSVATDRLIDEGCERIAFIGTSKGAEAAMLVAIDDHRVDAVVAISPSSVVWANVGPGRDGQTWPQRSSWTRNGIPLPFMRHHEAHLPPQGETPISYRELHEQSLIIFAGDLEAATIPLERARAEILLVAGGDDALWPSDAFARSIADRLGRFGKYPTVVGHPEAGHRVLLPGETTPRSTRNAYGGNDAADLALGRSAWRAIVNLLRLA